ncbi:MAG: hypothetical protein SAJ12_22525 [Jaaginema sp. PMC 1079.18]|nr:hypothetical protein [Jaaginema sp. PMC 1080.18]MEC4853765.1 hypothetical protein [Jaaginema sp. PMC 1079.18]MEC4864610.1 hypothetical protein [Jaaginema sp. PMC 1078.18]
MAKKHSKIQENSFRREREPTVIAFSFWDASMVIDEYRLVEVTCAIAIHHS